MRAVLALKLSELSSPLGTLLAVHGEAGLYALDFADCRRRMEQQLRRRGAVALTAAPVPTALGEAMAGYWAKQPAAVSIPLVPGGSPFQQRVWQALQAIPWGHTRSYGELATDLGSPGSARAVGLANSQNPIAIVVPCHRVIGSNGRLTGYAGGLERKRWLLHHEGALPDEDCRENPASDQLTLFS